MELAVERLEEWTFGDTVEIANWRPRREDLPEGWRPVVSDTDNVKPPSEQPRPE